MCNWWSFEDALFYGAVLHSHGQAAQVVCAFDVLRIAFLHEQRFTSIQVRDEIDFLLPLRRNVDCPLKVKYTSLYGRAKRNHFVTPWAKKPLLDVL
jgi:hypothetical protein